MVLLPPSLEVVRRPPPTDLLVAQPQWPICHLLFGLVSPLQEHRACS